MFALLGAKKITSSKNGRDWIVMHLGYDDRSYITGFAVDTVVVEPDLVCGEFVEGCKVNISRSPDGKRILAVDLIA